MELTKEEGREVVYDDHPDWEMVEGTREVDDSGRWSNYITAVFHHKPSGKHYLIGWGEGATEMQDYDGPFEYNDPELILVEAKQVMVTQWVPVKENDE